MPTEKRAPIESGECHSRRTRGVVFSGRGEGSFYVSIYARSFEEVLGFRPFPGTLNIRLQADIERFNECLERAGGVVVVPPKIEGAKLGEVLVFKARLIRGFDSWDVFIVRPKITHYRSDVVEIVSKEYLRGELKIKDGDVVEIEVYCC